MSSKNKASILKLDSADDVRNLLEEPSVKIAEVLTGVLSSGTSEYRLSAGRLVQATIKNQLLTQLGRELRQYQDKGKIKEDYFATNKSKASLFELLKFIDSDIPDEEVFKAIKQIFFNIVSIDADEVQEQVGYQLLQICKKLESMDVMVLRACYVVYLRDEHGNVHSHGDWVGVINNKVGYGLPDLIHISDDKLVRLGLLSERTHGDRSGIRTGREFRLTNLGMKLCEFITEWEE